MLKLGAFLKEKREEMGVSLDEIEKRTLISKRYLLSIEDDNFSIFPKRASATQMIRVYARFLGLQEHEIANLIRGFNFRTSPKFILFGKNSLIYIILLLILFIIITIFVFNL